MVSIEEFQKLKKRVDATQREADRAEGSLVAIRQELKTSFGVDSIQKAKELLEELQEEEEQMEKELTAAIAQFEEEWKKHETKED